MLYAAITTDRHTWGGTEASSQPAAKMGSLPITKSGSLKADPTVQSNLQMTAGPANILTSAS